MPSLLLVRPFAEDLDRAMDSAATAVVADLAHEPGTPGSREAVAAWLERVAGTASRPALLVRVHAFGPGLIDADLAALSPVPPDALMLSGCGSGEDVQRLGVRLGVIEAERHLAEGSIGIVAVAASSAAGVLALPTFAQASPRLRALTLDADALAQDLGLRPGQGAAPLVHARALTVLAAGSARVPALDSPFEASPEEAVSRYAKARQDGFRGAVTRDVGHIRLIAAAFPRGLEGSGLRRP